MQSHSYFTLQECFSGLCGSFRGLRKQEIRPLAHVQDVVGPNKKTVKSKKKNQNCMERWIWSRLFVFTAGWTSQEDTHRQALIVSAWVLQNVTNV